MTDWIEHPGGPQPVADDVSVEVLVAKGPHLDVAVLSDGPAAGEDWENVSEYRILNQHLIDAALKRGIELGLEAVSNTLREHENHWDVREAIELLCSVRLDPATIAKENAR
jgi:hypothetical protein